MTGTNTLVIARAGSDTINGGTSVTISSANGAYILWSDGSSKWTAQAIGASAASGVSTFNGRSGAVTPAQGDYTANLIPGTTTNDNATAGNIGEYVEVKVTGGSAISLTSGTITNVASIALGPGDWDVCAHISINPPSNANTLNVVSAGISTTSATLPARGLSGCFVTYLGIAQSTLPNLDYDVGMIRQSLNGSTTIYLVVQITQNAGSGVTAFGEIRARRVR